MGGGARISMELPLLLHGGGEHAHLGGGEGQMRVRGGGMCDGQEEEGGGAEEEEERKAGKGGHGSGI